MDLGLSGRVAIVTGGSSGIGRATVRTLVTEGCLVAACARRAERLASLAADVGDSGRLLTMAADVTDAKAMQRLVGATVAEFGRIDAIAALAGAVWGAQSPIRRVAVFTDESAPRRSLRLRSREDAMARSRPSASGRDEISARCGLCAL
jgi:NADP-dependent 3-hydroxy acid dehydrogenase YdfG